VFNGGGTVTISGTGTVLTLSGCANVTFAGFSGTFTSGATVLVTGATADCTFRNMSISQPVVTTPTTNLIFNLTGGTNTTIEDCTFGGGYEAFMIANAVGGTTIQRNRITPGGWWTGRIGGPNTTVRNNFFHGQVQYGLSCGISGSPTTAVNLKVQNNSFYITHPTGGSQFDILRWYSSATSEVTNNAFYDVQTGATTGFVMWCSGVLKPTLMDYNCYFQVLGTALIYSGANQTLASWQGLGNDLSSVSGDPQFVNIAATPPDLHINSGSPCLTAGTTIPSITDDIDGSPRIPPFDIGAHELTSGNLLSLVTSGGGAGDLVLSLTAISVGATEGFILLTVDTSTPLGSGPILGIRPDALTWTIFGYPSLPGSPFHFPIGVPGVFPATSFVLPPGTLSSLAGVTMDAVALVFGPAFGYIGRSNVVRVAW
jgi:hypothetical protein